MSDLKIKIDFEKIKKNLPLLIIIAATILEFILVYPLFKPGVLVNIDHPLHYSRIWCLQNSEMLPPSSWCAEYQAGFPTSAYYYPLIDLIIAQLGKIIGLALAYKLIIVLALFVPAIGAYLLLKTLGKKLAAAFAYALILMNPGSWHIGGFEEVVLVGMWAQVMTTGFLLIGVAFFIEFYRDPSYKKMIPAVLVTMFMTHPITIVAAVTVYSALILFQWKESLKKWKWVLVFLLLVASVNCYYAILLLLYGKYILPNTIGGMNWNYLKYYLIDKINWYFILSAVLGLLLLVKSKIKEKKPMIIITLVFLASLALSFIPAIDGPWFMGIRIEVLIAALVFMFAALFFDFLTNISIKIGKKIKINVFIVVLLFILAIAPMVNKSLNMSQKNVIIISEKDVSDVYSGFSKLPEGRVLVEETLYNTGTNFLTLTHFHLLIPAFTGREIIGVPYPYYPPHRYLATTENGMMFAKKLENYTDEEMNHLFELYNIKYIISHSPMYYSYFENRSKSKVQMGPFTVFETNINESFFKVQNGTLILEDYKKTYGKVYVNMTENGLVLMKVNPFPNWQAYIDNKKSKIDVCDGIMCVIVPQGEHIVEFKFKYSYANYFGYLISLIGLIVLCYLYLKSKRENEKN